MKLSISNLQKELRTLKDPAKANFLARYFKTGIGQYAEGDVFLGGITTATARKITKKYLSLSTKDTLKLLKSKYHEERWVALGILSSKKNPYPLYLKNTKYVNNWDLVDSTAPNIVGEYLLKHPEEVKILNKLAVSKNMWERRIAIMATYVFIKRNSFDKTFEISDILLNDKEDLIHKAVGWMLREVGKKNRGEEEKFLKKNYHQMPRTMLRYSIEKFPEELRMKYLKGSA